jgi:hypothetical protein
MANTLRIKRRTTGLAGAPSILKNAELAFNEVDDVLYYGKGVDGNGDATTIPAIGGIGAFVSLSANQTITGTKTVTGTLALTGATIDGFTTTGNVTVGGDLTVNGVTTTINSTTVSVDDKNIVLADTASPDDATSDGGGITLRGTTDKTFNWVDATDAWTSSEHMDLASGKSYYINGSQVLSDTALGSGVTSSSLTSVGTLTSGSWTATTIGTAYGGTGQTSYTDGELLIGNTATGSLSKATLAAGTGISITNGNGTITINAQETLSAGDGLDLAAGVLSLDLKANGGLVIESTELALDLGASSITGTLGVADGGTGQTSYTDGELLIGNTSGGLTKTTLTAGTNVSITNGNGAITINATDTNTTYTAGDGLDLVGTEFSLDIRAGRGLQITSTELDLDDDLATLAGMQSGAASALALLTSSEIAILDGATVTTAELNIIDGSTTATATTLALADRMVINDAGTMVQVALSDLVTFLEDGSTSGFDIDGGSF